VVAHGTLGGSEALLTPSLGVERLEVLALPRLAATLAEMKAAQVSDPVAVLRRLQSGLDVPEGLRQYGKVFATLRGLFTLDGNDQILEMAMREAITLCASVVI